MPCCKAWTGICGKQLQQLPPCLPSVAQTFQVHSNVHPRHNCTYTPGTSLKGDTNTLRMLMAPAASSHSPLADWDEGLSVGHTYDCKHVYIYTYTYSTDLPVTGPDTQGIQCLPLNPQFLAPGHVSPEGQHHYNSWNRPSCLSHTNLPPSHKHKQPPATRAHCESPHSCAEVLSLSRN